MCKKMLTSLFGGAQDEVVPPAVIQGSNVTGDRDSTAKVVNTADSNIANPISKSPSKKRKGAASVPGLGL